MMEGAILRKGPVCLCYGRYMGRLTQLRQNLCCDMGRSAAGRRWHRYGRLGSLTCLKREGFSQRS